MQEVVITAVGADRPGLVDELTGHLHDLGANLGDSRMVNLRGQFALLLLAEVPVTAAATIESSLRELGRRVGLTITATPQPAAGEGARAGAPGVPFRLRTYAMDKPGIVHRITHLLHEHSINIEELQTRLEAGSYASPPLFTMELLMTVPRHVQVRTLREEIESLCESLNCDVELRPA